MKLILDQVEDDKFCMNKYLPFLLIAICFLLLKISNLGIRLSDTNIYFYTGYQLLQGKVLYKDVFFTNFPLFPYISSLYSLLTGGSLLAYYFTAVIEAVITGFIVYVITLKQYKNMLLSSVCSTLYLFSFMLLSTTDHQSGVFIASLFAVTSYYFYTEKKYLLTGIFIALTLLTKAYFLPIFLTYIVMLLFERHHKEGESRSFISQFSTSLRSARTIKFILGFLATTLIVLLPTFLFARQDFIRDVFEYSLTRSEGIPKFRIFWFFLTHDLLITASLIYAIIMIRIHRFFGVLSLFGLAFFFLYKDVYYLYLNFFLPFLSLSFANLYVDIEKRFVIQKMILPTIIGIFLFVNLMIYMSGYRDLQNIKNIDQLVTAIKTIDPPYLYGGNGVTPALAYLTNTPLVNPMVDMNTNIFRKGFLSAEDLTKEALSKKAMFVGEGIDYPQFQTYQPITDEVVDLKQLQTKQCTLVTAVPIKTEGYQNRINLITCK